MWHNVVQQLYPEMDGIVSFVALHIYLPYCKSSHHRRPNLTFSHFFPYINNKQDEERAMNYVGLIVFNGKVSPSNHNNVTVRSTLSNKEQICKKLIAEIQCSKNIYVSQVQCHTEKTVVTFSTAKPITWCHCCFNITTRVAFRIFQTCWDCT